MGPAQSAGSGYASTPSTVGKLKVFSSSFHRYFSYNSWPSAFHSPKVCWPVVSSAFAAAGGTGRPSSRSASCTCFSTVGFGMSGGALRALRFQRFQALAEFADLIVLGREARFQFGVGADEALRFGGVLADLEEGRGLAPQFEAAHVALRV